LICVPSGVTSIGEYCFWKCTNLETIIFASDSKLISIGQSAFRDCFALASFCLPSLVETVGLRCFAECHLLSRLTFSLPSRVRELLDFRGQMVDIPDSVERVRTEITLLGMNPRTLYFGHESKLEQVELHRDPWRRVHHCFLRFSTRTLKRFRARFEF
jgi:hypothetical protein